MIKFIKNNWQIFFIESLIILAFIIFYGQFGDINVYSFRESFIPEQMVQGKTLYKDIFCTKAPLSYIINSILFFIFGSHLKILYFAGLLSTMGICYLTYQIALRFMDKTLALTICLFIISALVLSPNAFNSFFPYSYALLYGVLFIQLSIYFMLNKHYSLAYLFYSIAVCSQYEFIFLLPMLIYTEKFNADKINFKKNIFIIITPLIFSLIALNGISITDILKSIGDAIAIGATGTLYHLYSSFGLTLRLELVPLYIINLIKFIVPIHWVNYQNVLIWIIPFITILLILRYKHLNFEKRIFICSCILVSAKTFFALTLNTYGVFFLPFVLISLAILTPHKFRTALTIILLIWSIAIGGQNISYLKQKDVEILTQKGFIKTTKYNGRAVNKLIKYIDSTDNNSRIVIYPEGLCINFLTNRNGDTKYFSLLPLYEELWGESKIIEHLQDLKPDYIVISNYDTSDYYYSGFGQDYATSIYDWIKQNYKLEQTINGGMIFEVFKY